MHFLEENYTRKIKKIIKWWIRKYVYIWKYKLMEYVYIFKRELLLYIYNNNNGIVHGCL